MSRPIIHVPHEKQCCVGSRRQIKPCRIVDVILSGHFDLFLIENRGGSKDEPRRSVSWPRLITQGGFGRLNPAGKLGSFGSNRLQGLGWLVSGCGVVLKGFEVLSLRNRDAEAMWAALVSAAAPICGGHQP